MLLPTTTVVLLLYASVAIGVTAAVLAWRRRPNPGTVPLVWLLVGQSWWSTCILFTLSADAVGEKLLWTKLGWIGVMIVPVAWLLFALEYTGRDERITRRSVVALSVVPALTVLIALTAPFHDLLYVRAIDRAGDGLVLIEQGGVWYVVAAVYTYLLGVVGILPIVEVLSSRAAAFRGQSTALVVGIVTPWATNVLYNSGLLPSAGIDPTPIAFAVSGVAYLGAIDRFRMFGANPAPTLRAREFLFDHIHEGAIVVDENGTIVDINETGAAVLGLDVDRALGTPAAERLPTNGAFRTDGGDDDDFLIVGSDSTSRSYDVTVTEITDRHGRTLGHVFTLHEVTQYLRQQQRLTVLNRVLRHNIRTETNIIYGYADRLGTENAETIKRHTTNIVDLSEKGRDAIDLFEDAMDGDRTQPLHDVLDACLDDVSGRFPNVSFRIEYPEPNPPVSDALGVVVDNLVENAAAHNEGDTPCVVVTVEVDGGRLRVRVADDGPGIDEYELGVIESGTETALRHGSGIGLWLVKWGTEMLDGSVSFERNEPAGTVVTVTAPIDGPDGTRSDVP